MKLLTHPLLTTKRDFSLQKYFVLAILAWDSYECHMTDSVGKYLKEMNLDSVIIQVCTKYIQGPDVCWNKPFKAKMTELYDQWLSEGVHQFTEGGNMKPPSIQKAIK